MFAHCFIASREAKLVCEQKPKNGHLKGIVLTVCMGVSLAHSHLWFVDIRIVYIYREMVLFQRKLLIMQVSTDKVEQKVLFQNNSKGEAFWILEWTLALCNLTLYSAVQSSLILAIHDVKKIRNKANSFSLNYFWLLITKITPMESKTARYAHSHLIGVFLIQNSLPGNCDLSLSWLKLRSCINLFKNWFRTVPKNCNSSR